MSLPMRMVQFYDTPSGPLVSYGQCSPVKDNGGGGDGEKILARVIDLHCTTVLYQIH